MCCDRWYLIFDEGQDGRDDDGAEHDVGEKVEDGGEEEDGQQDHPHAKRRRQRRIRPGLRVHHRSRQTSRTWRADKHRARGQGERRIEL